MFREGTILPCVGAHGAFENHRPIPGITALMVAALLLNAPRALHAQRSAAGRSRRPIVCIHDCPSSTDTVISENDLKTFDHLIAVEANEQQSASFADVVKDTELARTRLEAFGETLKVASTTKTIDRAATVNQTLDKARTGTRDFLASLSPVQKSGLKDVTDKLVKADSDLDKEMKVLDEILRSDKPGSEHLSSSIESLRKALAGFWSDQLALASEMGVILPSSGQELTFNLPPITNSVNIAGQPISVPVSGVASRTSVADGNSFFNLKLVADFSDLQQDMTQVLRATLDRSPRCGERIEIQEGSLIPLAPASLALVHLHYERWICPGPGSATELAIGDGSIEVKLIASVGPNADFRLASEITRADGDDFLRELLLHGSIGDTLREHIATLVLLAMQRSADPKASLPPVAQGAARIQKAEFQDAEIGQLTLVVDGQLQFSDEQTKQFASQLKQRLAAQESAAAR